MACEQDTRQITKYEGWWEYCKCSCNTHGHDCCKICFLCNKRIGGDIRQHIKDVHSDIKCSKIGNKRPYEKGLYSMV